MSIRLDSTDYSTVVTCDDCATYYRLASSRREGRHIAADHELRAHPERSQARDTLDKGTQRRAAAARR